MLFELESTSLRPCLDKIIGMEDHLRAEECRDTNNDRKNNEFNKKHDRDTGILEKVRQRSISSDLIIRCGSHKLRNSKSLFTVP